MCVRCGHLFCRACVGRLLRACAVGESTQCPHCRSPLSYDLCRLSKFLERQIQSLTCVCPDCDGWQGALATLSEHGRAECSGRLVSCAFAKFGCADKVRMRDLSAHLEDCELEHLKLQVSWQQAQLERKDELHRRELEALNKSWRRKCVVLSDWLLTDNTLCLCCRLIEVHRAAESGRAAMTGDQSRADAVSDSAQDENDEPVDCGVHSLRIDDAGTAVAKESPTRSGHGTERGRGTMGPATGKRKRRRHTTALTDVVDERRLEAGVASEEAPAATAPQRKRRKRKVAQRTPLASASSADDTEGMSEPGNEQTRKRGKTNSGRSSHYKGKSYLTSGNDSNSARSYSPFEADVDSS